VRRIGTFLVATAVTILLTAAPVSASAGSDYVARRTCTQQYYAVYISSYAENWVDYYWDAPGHVKLWNPSGSYWGYNTGDTSTWAVVEWDHAKDGPTSTSCRSVTG
jgi:hypothetical protein